MYVWLVVVDVMFVVVCMWIEDVGLVTSLTASASAYASGASRMTLVFNSVFVVGFVRVNLCLMCVLFVFWMLVKVDCSVC